MLSIAINAGAIVLGSLIGLLIKNAVNKVMTDAMMVGIGFFTVFLGVTGLPGTGTVSSIVYLLAIIFGGVLGTLLKIEDRIHSFADSLQSRLAGWDGDNRFASGFVGFFILSSVGAYTVVASFNVGLGDPTMLYTKSVMDFIVSLAMASTLGIGVLFAGIPIILYESLLAGFSGALSSFLSEGMIEAFSCMGAILTLGIGTNVAGVTKFKITNYLPALLFAPLLAGLLEHFI